MDLSSGDGAAQNALTDLGVDPSGGWEDTSASAAPKGSEGNPSSPGTDTHDAETDWGIKPAKDPAHDWDDASPANAAPPILPGTRTENPYDHAAQQVAAINANEIGRASLLCGFAAQTSGIPVSDAALAREFGTTPGIIAVCRDDFVRRMAIVNARNSLSTSPVLCRTILRNPYLAPHVQPDLQKLAAMEKTLAQKPGAGDYAYELLKGFAGFSNDALQAASIIAAAPLVGVDKLAGLVTGEQGYSALEDAWFDNTSQHLADNRSYFAYDPATGFAGKVAHAVGNLADMAPYVVLTGGTAGEAAAGGEAAAESAGVVSRIGARLADGTKAMAVPASVAGVNSANDVYGATGSGASALGAGAMTTGTSMLQGAIPLSLPGNILTRALTGIPVGVATGEGARWLNNLALPESMQRPFDPENAAVNGLIGSLMAGLGSNAAPVLRAAHDYERLNSIGEISKNAALRQGDPATFKQMVRGMADAGDLDTLYVPGTTFARHMLDAGISMPELAGVLPETASQLLQAIRTGGDISLPLEDYATHIAGGALDTILPFVKTDPNGKSFVEAEAALKERAREITRQRPDTQAEDGSTQAEAEEEKAGPQDESADEPPPTDPDLEQNAKAAGQLYNKLLKLNELAKESPLSQSDPPRFAQQVQKIMGLNPSKGFLVNGRVLLGVFRKYCKGQKNSSLLENLQTIAPSLARDLPQAIETNGDVSVPFDVFTAHLADKMDGLIPFAKPAPGMPSHAEAQAQLKGEPNPAENHGNTGAESWGDTHPPLPREQVKVPGGGLRANEAIGGHVLEKHAGKTEQELLDRNIAEPTIPAASSFYNEAVAEDAIAAALKANDAKIKAWLASGKYKLPNVTEITSTPVGITIPNGSTVARPAYGVKLVLIRDSMAPNGYYILTGYPE